MTTIINWLERNTYMTRKGATYTAYTYAVLFANILFWAAMLAL